MTYIKHLIVISNAQEKIPLCLQCPREGAVAVTPQKAPWTRSLHCLPLLLPSSFSPLSLHCFPPPLLLCPFMPLPTSPSFPPFSPSLPLRTPVHLRSERPCPQLLLPRLLSPPPQASSTVSSTLMTESACKQKEGGIYCRPFPPQPAPGYQTRPSAGRSHCSTSRDVGWTEELLREANKYIKFPAGAGDKGSGR